MASLVVGLYVISEEGQALDVATLLITTVAGATYVGCAALWVRADRQEHEFVDDLKNPEVRLKIQRAHKEEVGRYVSTPEAAKALSFYPQAKPFIDGLALIDYEDNPFMKQEARKALARDMIAEELGGGTREASDFMSTHDVAEVIMWKAIDMMTLPKGATMLRKVDAPESKAMPTRARKVAKTKFHDMSSSRTGIHPRSKSTSFP